MAETNLNKISPSQYEAYNKLLSIANKYTDVQNEEFLRSGLFGYITESMAMIMRDSSIHNMMLYNESFLNTAVMPKSIYNWSKMFNINISNATPAYSEATITLSENDFKSYSRSGASFNVNNKYGVGMEVFKDKNVLIIDKSNNFIAGDFNFMLEHSIIIYESNGSYLAQYILDEENETTNFQTFTSPILPVLIYSDGYGDVFISIECRLYQYKIETKKKTIATTSFIDRKIHEFEFNDQFVKCFCDYKKGRSKKVNLYYSNIDNIVNDEAYAFYSLSDENKLQIKFPDSAGAFTPASNSELTVRVITTKGSAGNISYASDLICRLNEEDLRNLPLLVEFNDQKAYGGLNKPTFPEIKQKIINEISTRDTIVTESDLNIFFNNLRSLLETINFGEVKFRKKRDDILQRVFTAYIHLKDLGTFSDTGLETPADIPTNTVDVDFSLLGNTSIPFGGSVMKLGSRYMYNAKTSEKVASKYIIPFYTYISLNPIRKVKYIYNLTNDSTALSYYSVSNSQSSSSVMIPSTVSIKRGFDSTKAEDSYKFIFEFSTNFNAEENSNSGDSNSKFILSFKGNLQSPIEFSKNDTANVRITSGSVDETTGVAKTRIELKLNVDENGEFYFPDNESNSTEYGSFIHLKKENISISLPEEVTPILELQNITLNNDIFNMSFVATEPLSLFKPLDDIMNSDIILNYSERNTEENGEVETSKIISGLTIKDVPILNVEFIKDTTTGIEDFISQLFIYINLLKENLEKLETNTFFDLKFFNTSGDSKLFNTPTTDIKLELTVRLKAGVDPETYRTSIQNFVRTLVDSSNDDGVLRVSHIITATVAQYRDVIENIDFEGLNDTFSQYIKPISMSSKEKSLITPEHFNIPTKNLQYIRVIRYDEE